AIRIGAVIIVIFAGFAPVRSARAAGSRGRGASLPTDGTYRKGKDVPLKGIVDDAVRDAPTVETVVVLRRGKAEVPMTPGRDITWADFLAEADGEDDSHVECESSEPAFILATSGTTAKPKLAVHTHGGYQVYVYSM